MRIALIHFLAIKPQSEDEIAAQTRIPKLQLPGLLAKSAEKVGSNWELSAKSYKDLTPWTFSYQNGQQRQAAIDNAIRAFDRLRIAKNDKLWQVLLPTEDRGKGIVLSRLQQGTERRDQTGTPGLAPTPIHDTTEKPTSAMGTPKIAAASTPRNGASATGRSAAGISIEKRLKDAKKKQDQEKKKQDQEKKKMESAASDRETKSRESKPRPVPVKKVPAKKVSDKVKSDEIVHDSDDDDNEEGEIVEARPRKSISPANNPPKVPPKPKAAVNHASNASVSKSEHVAGPPTSKREKAVDGPGATKNATSSTPASSVNRPKAKPLETSKQPPSQKVAAKNPATRESSAQQPISPRKTTRPKVPSPLGTSKPRNASEEAEKVPKIAVAPRPSRPSKPTTPAVSATRVSQQPASAIKPNKMTFFGEATGRPGPVIKKRPLEHADNSSESLRKVPKISGGSSSNNTAKAGVPDTAKPSVGNNKPTARPKHENGSSQPAKAAPQDAKPRPSSQQPNSDNELKRKANDTSSGIHDHDMASIKHRKTNSSSTHSQGQTGSSLSSLTTAPTVSPSASTPRSPPSQMLSSTDDVIQMFLNDAEASPKTQSTWESALDKAAKFRTQLYPAYLALYDRLESAAPEDVDEEDRRILFMMHSKLKAYKLSLIHI